MVKNSVSDYDADPVNNTDVGGINIEGGSLPSNFDNSQRQIMAHLKDEHNNVYALLRDNLLINGGFNINQDNVSGTVTLAAYEYCHDMWRAGGAGCQYTFSTANNVTTVTIISGTLQNQMEGDTLETDTYCLSWTGTAQGSIQGSAY